MVEFVGLINVNIVRGTDLAVRDMVSSDPYVIITLGNQVNTILWVFTPFIVLIMCVCFLDVDFVYVAVSEDASHKEQPQPRLERKANALHSGRHSSS